MKFAGREFVLRQDLWMGEAKRGLQLADALREGMKADIDNGSSDINQDLFAKWKEFCGIAFEGGWPGEYKDMPEPMIAGEMLNLFIVARLRAKESLPSEVPSQV